MRFSKFTFGLALVVAVCAFALAGCAHGAQVSHGVQVSHGDATDQGLPPPVTLTDTSPARLGVSIGITIGGYDAASRNITEIAIEFLSNGQVVQFARGETLACTGVKPTILTTSFDYKYATSAVANTLITCVYTSGHATASIHFQVPSAPTIIAPTEGASVARSGATPVRYQAQGDIEGIVALGTEQKAIAHLAAPGQAALDTSAFAIGPGSISLSQYPTVANAQATWFAALQTECTAMTQVDVMWS